MWFKEADGEFLKELKKEYGWDKVSAWSNSTFFTISMPYLGIDGLIAMFSDKYPDESISIETSLIEASNKLMVKAIVKAGDKVHSEGLAEVPFMTKKEKNSVGKWVAEFVLDEQGNRIFDSVEIPTSNAIRKALAYTGLGRFPTYKTEFGDNKFVKEFREFCLKDKG